VKKNSFLNLHPVVNILIITLVVGLLSLILHFLDVSQIVYNVDHTTFEFSTKLLSVTNLFSYQGLRDIFSTTVSNFVGFTPLSSLIIILLGFGLMEKSGFLKTSFTLLTKKMKKNTVTFIIVFLSVVGSLIGDLSYIIMLPLSGLLFKYGKRNPLIGIVASFAGLTIGSGISAIFTATDSSLLSYSLQAARAIDINYRMASISGVFIMFVALILITILVTAITERVVAPRLSKYEIKDEEEEKITRKEIRGMLFAGFAGLIYFLIILWNIIPGLPLSGRLLDHSQVLYVDKLFSLDSFFSQGFIFIVTMFFVILGFFYGLGARTIKGSKDAVSALGYSLDGIGNTLVFIFVGSLLISVFRKTGIGEVIVASLTSLFRTLNFTGFPLIILLFIVSVIATIFVPTSVSKWAIMSPVVVPVFMQAGLSPEYAQIIFRFGESVTMGITPFMAYFIIYLALLNKNAKDGEYVTLKEAIKYQLPYVFAAFAILLIILLVWFVVGLPLGINGSTTL